MIHSEITTHGLLSRQQFYRFVDGFWIPHETTICILVCRGPNVDSSEECQVADYASNVEY